MHVNVIDSTPDKCVFVNVNVNDIPVECVHVNNSTPAVIVNVNDNPVECVNVHKLNADVNTCLNNTPVNDCVDDLTQRQTSYSGASTSKGKRPSLCDSAWKRQTCYNCAAAGHIARNCPLPRPPSPEKDKTHVSRGKLSTPKPVKSNSRPQITRDAQERSAGPEPRSHH